MLFSERSQTGPFLFGPSPPFPSDSWPGVHVSGAQYTRAGRVHVRCGHTLTWGAMEAQACPRPARGLPEAAQGGRPSIGEEKGGMRLCTSSWADFLCISRTFTIKADLRSQRAQGPPQTRLFAAALSLPHRCARCREVGAGAPAALTTGDHGGLAGRAPGRDGITLTLRRQTEPPVKGAAVPKGKQRTERMQTTRRAPGPTGPGRPTPAGRSAGRVRVELQAIIGGLPAGPEEFRTAPAGNTICQGEPAASFNPAPAPPG